MPGDGAAAWLTMTDDRYAAQVKERALKWAEGVAALTVLVSMRSCVATLEAMKNTDDPLVRSVMFNGFVVNYSRGFENVYEPRTGIESSFKIKRLKVPGFSKSIHDTLLRLRNQQIAHAGHSLNDYSLTFLRVTINNTFTNPDGTAVTSTMMRRNVGTRAKASIATGPTSDMELILHFRALDLEARNRLTKSIIDHDAASMFRLHQEYEEGTNLSEILNSKTLVNSATGGKIHLGEEGIAFSRASSPDSLPLEFTTLTFSVALEDGALILQSRGIATN